MTRGWQADLSILMANRLQSTIIVLDVSSSKTSQITTFYWERQFTTKEHLKIIKIFFKKKGKRGHILSVWFLLIIHL